MTPERPLDDAYTAAERPAAAADVVVSGEGRAGELGFEVLRANLDVFGA